MDHNWALKLKICPVFLSWFSSSQVTLHHEQSESLWLSHNVFGKRGEGERGRSEGPGSGLFCQWRQWRKNLHYNWILDHKCSGEGHLMWKKWSNVAHRSSSASAVHKLQIHCRIYFLVLQVKIAQTFCKESCNDRSLFPHNEEFAESKVNHKLTIDSALDLHWWDVHAFCFTFI